jgi:hypothetical protein
MLIGNLSVNESFFDGWTFDKFKVYFKNAKLAESSGVTAEQMAKILKIEIPKKEVEAK